VGKDFQWILFKVWSQETHPFMYAGSETGIFCTLCYPGATNALSGAMTFSTRAKSSPWGLQDSNLGGLQEEPSKLHSFRGEPQMVYYRVNLIVLGYRNC
jgi:hypothetical protein